jgi:hypothetical protein
VTKFISEHGQSLDWILVGNPNSMICILASNSPRADALASTDQEGRS